MQPKKTPPADIRKASFPPATPNKSFKVVSNASIRDRENFSTLARSLGLAVWDLIEFNFPGSRNRPDVVNWYLYEKMGCREVSADGRNFLLSLGMKVYHPTAQATPAPGITPPAKHPFRQGWTPASIAAFRQYVLQQGRSFAYSSVMRMDCANFALHLVLQFARNHYLPVAFQYVGGVVVADFESILSFGSFMDRVKRKVGAPDLFETAYAHAVTLPNFVALEAGDFLSAHKHVMVFYRSPSLIEIPGVVARRPVMEILQGNLDTAPIPWREVPISTPVQHRAFDLQIKAGYVNLGKGWEVREDHVYYQDHIVGQFVPRRWDFSWFNQVYGFPAV